MADLEQTQETLIAPHEVRELVSRLTEASVEFIPADEPRTLEGLALNTGIPVGRLREELVGIRGTNRRMWPFILGAIALVVIGFSVYRFWPKPAPTAAPALVPPSAAPLLSAEADTRGLVPLTSVTYGPDIGSVLVDPTFEPSQPLTPGLSITGQVGAVLWGAGDQRAAVVRSRLSSEQVANLKQAYIELLQHVRERAGRRKMPLSKPFGSAKVSYDGLGYSIHTSIHFFYGTAGGGAHVPPPGVDDKEAERIIKNAADQAVETFQGLITNFDSHRLERGPR